jgi:hypothetical protein
LSEPGGAWRHLVVPGATEGCDLVAPAAIFRPAAAAGWYGHIGSFPMTLLRPQPGGGGRMRGERNDTICAADRYDNTQLCRSPDRPVKPVICAIGHERR